MAFEYRQGDSGGFMELAFEENGSPISIATATTKEFVLVDPRGVATARAGAFSTDGTDGKLELAVTPDFWPTSGKWRVFGHVVIPDAPNADLDRYSQEIAANISPTYGRA